MTAGRKASPAPQQVPDTLDGGSLTTINATSQVVAAADVTTLQAAELHKLVGRIETAHFYETVSAKLIAQTYSQAKALLGEMGFVTVRGPDGKAKHVSGMDEFCEAVMPVSARRCQQIVANVALLGETLFEQAEKIGFRARDYAALKALPPDEQAVVKAAIENGTRDEVVDLLADLAARNEALRRKAAEAEKTVAAKDKVIAKKDAKLNELAEREELLASDEAEALKALRTATIDAELALAHAAKVIDQVMQAPASEAADLAARQSIDYLVRRLVEVCTQRGITVDLAEQVAPAWAAPIAEAVRKGAKG